MKQVEERKDVQNDILLTLEDLAEVFDVDVSTVEDWINRKLLRAICVTPQYDMRFRLDDICKFINEHEQIWVPTTELESEVPKSLSICK